MQSLASCQLFTWPFPHLPGQHRAFLQRKETGNQKEIAIPCPPSNRVTRHLAIEQIAGLWRKNLGQTHSETESISFQHLEMQNSLMYM